MINDITYHVGKHIIESSMRHFPATEDTSEFCVLYICFLAGYEEVSKIHIVVYGNIEDAKAKLAAIKAAL